jgi:hypothetical protein
MKLQRGWIAILLLACIAAPAAYAQSTSGSISGTVTDPNGAVVPGAKILATHEPTKRDYATVSTEAGIYVFPNLPVGPYTITVEHPGFKKLARSNIEVRVGLRQTLDLQLEVGDVQERVEVKAEVPLLETVSPERGQNLSPQFLTTLPIYTGGMRSAEAFLGYMPGVNSYGELSINGSGGRAREVMIDGASLTIPESGGTVFNFPGIEAFNEMKLVTSTYNAEFGRLGGGVELMVTKSGSNDIHGAAFLNMRRDIWNAAGWSSNQNTKNPPGYRAKERYNEAGGAAGGPVWIPKVYDGRNKTFFYFTYARDIRPASIAINSGETLPTVLMKQGVFTEVAPIYDPATTAVVNGVNTRLPFAGNAIPQDRFSKISKNLLPLIPNPQTSATTANYQYIASTVLEDYIWTLKFDHSITQNNRIAFFLSRENQTSTSDQYWPGPLSNGLQSFQKPDNYRVNHDLVIKPTVLLHSTFGFTRQQQQWDNPLQKGWGSKLGFPLTGKSDATPVIAFTSDMPSPGGLGGWTTWGMQQGKVAEGGQWNWTTHVSQQMTWVRSKHEFKMGWDLRRLRTFGNDLASTNGFYYFNRAQTADPTRLTATGHAFASLLLGAVDNANAGALPYTPLQARYGYHAGFFQDSWRLTPRFTFDYGIRYEVPIGWHEVTGSYSTVDLTKPNPKAAGLPGALIFAGVGAGRTGAKRVYPTDFSDIGPRAGFAYRMFDKTVIRGGFGIYYQTLGNGGCGCTDGFNGSYSQLSDGLNPAFNWDQGGVKPPPGYRPPPFLDPSFDNFNSVTRMGPNFGKAPRIYNWSLTIQQEFRNWLFEAAYVGNRGHGLNSTVELNQLPTSYLSLGPLLGKKITDPAVVAAGYKEPFPGFAAGWGGGATLAQALRPYPQFGAISDLNAGAGRTWYDSLQTKVERRFGAWQFMGSYVWSKSLGMLHYRQIFSQGANVQAQDAYNLNESKSFLPMDLPHVFNILNSYSLPFGRGRKFFGSANRVTNLIVGGWVISSAHQYRSSGLIQVLTPGNPLGSGQIFSRLTKANLTGNPIRTGVSRGDLDPNNPNVRWFNYGANSPFVAAPAYTLGNAASYYSDFRNPPVLNENISIVKNFAFWESVRLQYRADAINAFNRTCFGGINGTVGNADFGRPGGVQVGPRIITMGLRLEW